MNPNLDLGVVAGSTGRCDVVRPMGGESIFVKEHLCDHTAGAKAEAYLNSLDQALAVLMARCCPPPQVSSLARTATNALCDEWQRQTGQTLAENQRQRWARHAEQTRSFDELLQELAHQAPLRSLERLTEAGLKGLLSASGWASACVLPPEQKTLLKDLEAVREAPGREPGSLGLMLDRWPVVDVVPQSPAAEAGLTPTDTILKIEGQNVSQVVSRGEIIRLLAGAVGQPVTLTVRRGQADVDVRVVRASAGANQVTTTPLDAGILLVRVPTLEGSGVANKAIRLIRQDHQVSAVILDLRDNPGGRPEEANALASLFLDGQLLQVYQFSSGKRIGVRANTAGALRLPVVVLTNQNTGSAAEMVAMALRDNGRAKVVGEPTAGALFGKDLQELKDGRVMIFRSEPVVLSPSGRDYSSGGIPPDAQVADSRGDGCDAILARAVQLLMKETRNPLGP